MDEGERLPPEERESPAHGVAGEIDQGHQSTLETI